MAGGGVPEAMLIGAAVGAGTGGIMSAAQDKDPLEGALLGAALGAAGGGIGSWAGGATAGANAGVGSSAVPGAVSSTAPGAGVSSLASGTPVWGNVGGSAVGEVGGFASGAGGTLGGGAGGGGGGAVSGTVGGQGGGVFGTVGGEATGTVGGYAGGTGGGAGGATGGGANWGAQGLGEGFAPALTNAQAYGAGIGGGITGLIGQSAQNQNNMAPEPEEYTGPLSQFKYNPQTFRPNVAPGYADGGVASLGRQTGLYPQSQMDRTQFAVPSQMPVSREVIGSDYDSRISPYTGDMMMASGGISSLGSYSDGGRMLKGPGDGMSDDIPGVIAGKQPARLADGEFVVPADVVSHLGNGSTDAGAKKLYSMMDNVRKARTGSKKQGRQIKAEKYVPGMASGGRVKHYAGGNLVVQDGQIGYYDDSGNFNQLNSSQAPSLGVGATSSTGFKPTGFDPNYYNPQYYQNQLAKQQESLKSAQSQLDAYKASGQYVAPNQTTGSLYDLSNLSDTAKQNADINKMYQRYLGRNIGQGEAFSTTEEGIAGSPEAAAWAKYSNPVIEAQKGLEPIQQNISRLEQSGIKYDPYTLSGRPSSSEPQFYGNIYQPEYENYTRPDYSLSGELGQWSNVAGDTQRYVEGLYNTELGRGSDPEGLRNWTAQLQSGNLDPTQVRQGFWGSQEYRNLHPEHQLPTQMQPNFNQLSAGQAAAQQQSLANAQEAAMHSRNMINASVAAGENKPPQEEKKRKGGIASLTRR